MWLVNSWRALTHCRFYLPSALKLNIQFGVSQGRMARSITVFPILNKIFKHVLGKIISVWQLFHVKVYILHILMSFLLLDLIQTVLIDNVKEYGTMYRLAFGNYKSVILSSPESIEVRIYKENKLICWKIQQTRIWVCQMLVLITKTIHFLKVVLKSKTLIKRAPFYCLFEPWMGKDSYFLSGKHLYLVSF